MTVTDGGVWLCSIIGRGNNELGSSDQAVVTMGQRSLPAKINTWPVIPTWVLLLGFITLLQLATLFTIIGQVGGCASRGRPLSPLSSIPSAARPAPFPVRCIRHGHEVIARKGLPLIRRIRSMIHSREQLTSDFLRTGRSMRTLRTLPASSDR